MLYRTPSAVAGITLAIAAPWVLHGHTSLDCNPAVELCAVSDALYLPDDPAPEPTPSLIISTPAATGGSTSINLRADGLVTGSPNIGSPSLTSGANRSVPETLDQTFNTLNVDLGTSRVLVPKDGLQLEGVYFAAVGKSMASGMA
jgi:hypothetical protein